jgi:hypothetical protein
VYIFLQRNNAQTKKQNAMNWKDENKDYINESVSLTTGIVIFIICILIGCLAGNL